MDEMWVRWGKNFRGQTGLTKWHHIDGLRDGWVTVCDLRIKVFDSILMEQPGVYRQDTRPKSRLCSHCLAKLNG